MPTTRPPIQARSSRSRKRSFRQRLRGAILRGIVLTALVCGVAGACIALYGYAVVEPQVSPISMSARAQIEELVAQQGSHFLSLDQLGEWLPLATLAIEDQRFYDHGPIDIRATMRALLFDARGGRPLQAGSTIEVQLAERLLGSGQNDPFTHTLQVLMLAHDLDARYGKRGVFALYLNDIYYGSGAYGAEEAAQTFFRVSPTQLTLAQASFLAGLPNAPAIYGDNPGSSLTRARWRQVLQALVRTQQLHTNEVQALLSGPTQQQADANSAAS